MEQWKNIPGYEGLYQASNLGSIKSLKFGKEKILKAYKNKEGYLIVKIYFNGKIKNYLIHRLVALSFILNTTNKPCVNHKNGIKDDNKLENLEWVTYSENNQHSYSKLGRIGALKGKIGKYNLLSKKINQYTREGVFVKTWDSISDINRVLGLSTGNLSRVCKGKRNYSGGYKWEYFNLHKNN